MESGEDGSREPGKRRISTTEWLWATVISLVVVIAVLSAALFSSLNKQTELESPKAVIKIVEWSNTNDSTRVNFVVKLTNMGNDIGKGRLYYSAIDSSKNLTKYFSVTMAPVETTSYNLNLDFGTHTALTVYCWFEKTA